MNIGEVILKLRKNKKVKQKDLASDLGISATYLCLVENGEQKPSMDLIAKVARYFDLPVSLVVYMAMDRDHMTNEKQQEYFNTAKPIIEKLTNYLLSDNNTAQGKDLVAKVTKNLKKRNKV